MKPFRLCAALGLCLGASWARAAPPAPTPDPHIVIESGRRVTIAPEVLAGWARGDAQANAAASDLDAGRYSLAEREARRALAEGSPLVRFNSTTREMLAAALEGQGRRRQALQAYQSLLESAQKSGPPAPARALLSYALLLLDSGDWPRAVSLYHQAQSQFPVGMPIRANPQFSPAAPRPGDLNAALHISLGYALANDPPWRGTRPDENAGRKALAQFALALRSQPGNALANYYYWFGWRKLGRDARTDGDAARADAALRNAAQLGRGDVRDAAREALAGLNRSR